MFLKRYKNGIIKTMTMPSKTIGHGVTQRLLDLQVASSKFSHAYLFYGPEGVGKKKLALEFAGKILGTEHALSHADFSILDIEGDVKTEQVKEFMTGLSFAPFVGKYKVAVINNADLLNVQSSNALLKTLEEPSDSTIIILIASGKHMLPTIVSRCQAFSFGTLSEQELTLFAQSQSIPVTAELLSFSFGIPSRLLALSEGKELQLQKQQKAELIELISAAPAQRLLAVTKLSELEDEDLLAVLRSWTLLAKQSLKEHAKPKTLSALTESLRQMTTNKNKKLILQSLLLSI